MSYYTIEAIRKANRDNGYKFFNADTIRFFSSRISDLVYQGKGGVYFVTSERREFDPKKGRIYNVRQFVPETGNVRTPRGAGNRTSKGNAHALAKIYSEKGAPE